MNAGTVESVPRARQARQTQVFPEQRHLPQLDELLIQSVLRVRLRLEFSQLHRIRALTPQCLGITLAAVDG